MDQAGKGKKGVLIVIGVVVLCAILGGVGYWLGTRDSDEATSTVATETEEGADTKAPATDDTEAAPKPVDEYCSDASSEVYTNELIGLEFCYPAVWGATALNPPQASASASGSGYEISFSAYDTVVSSITSDYQNTIGRGGRCEDATNMAPDFSLYREAWIEDSSDPELAVASRYHIKKDGVYLVSEIVDSFSGGLCFSATINQSGTAYPVVKVALRRPLDTLTVGGYVANPEALFSASERTDFMSVVDSVRKPE